MVDDSLRLNTTQVIFNLLRSDCTLWISELNNADELAVCPELQWYSVTFCHLFRTDSMKSVRPAVKLMLQEIQNNKLTAVHCLREKIRNIIVQRKLINKLPVC